MKLGCRCDGDKAQVRKHWAIIDYKCNYSEFSGYQKTPSDYSSVTCSKCGAAWRTKAGYVDALPMSCD